MYRKIIAFVLTVAAGAGAVDVTDWLSINGTNEAVYMRQREDGHRWTWDTLQTEVWAWRFAAGVEAEFNHPRRPVFESNDPSDFDIEGDEIVQRYARYRDDIFDLRAGDFDKTLGKGMTLRSYEDRDYGVYQRLDGGVADASVAFGEREWGDVTALWGRSSRQIEAKTPEGPEEIGKDKVSGGQLTVRPVDFFYLTGSAVRAEVKNEKVQGYPIEENTLYASGLGGGWQYFDLYGEYATRDGYDAFWQEDRKGKGFYGIVTGYLPRSSISFQYKLYDDLAYRYNNPPPVSVDEYMITGPSSLTPPGEWGYYVQASANPVTDVRVRGGYSYADDKVGENDVKTEEVEQYFANVRYDLPWPVVVEGEYEQLGNLHISGEDVTGDIRRMPSLAVSWTPWDAHSFSAKFVREEKTDYTLAGVFVSNRADVGYTYSSWLGLTVSYEDSDETDRELVRPGLDPLKDPDVYRFKNNWLWGEVRLSWYNKVFQNHVLTIGYGSRRGGYVCSSGVCQTEVSFTGLKVALESSF